MEPFSTLAIATAVTQFLDFTSNIVSGTWTIYKSGSEESEKNAEIRTITETLMDLNTNLQASAQSPSISNNSPHQQQILKLSERCNELGNKLISPLNRLSSQNKHQLWPSFKVALRTIWSQGEIDSLQRTIESYRQQIAMYMVVSLRDDVDAAHRRQQANDMEAQKILHETQKLCRKTLKETGNGAKWQNELVEAIKHSYEHEARGPCSTVPYNKLRTRDVQEANQQLLCLLRFREIDFRYERIASAYQRTFQWIFRPPASNSMGHKWADFNTWARGDGPMYWITGKAGAGKSTLMRFIYDDKRTSQGLGAWAKGRPLIRANFFLWNYGTDIQMSNEGLVRTLLYQILRQLPHMVPDVFPYRSEVGFLFGEQVLPHLLAQDPCTWEELIKAFRTLLTSVTRTHKSVFFLDGLDEFQGQPSDIIDFLTELLTVPGIKICASSRPWIPFEDAFNHRPHLTLEDLTYNDIKHYVSTKFSANAGFKIFQQAGPTFCLQLIKNVCVKSSGVFLWVTLVTQSLVDGLSNGERLSDLQTRLDELPVDLENLFWRILNNLSNLQLQRASQLFQLVNACLVPLTLLDMSYVDEDDVNCAIKAPCRCLTMQQAHWRAELMRRRLNACCKGLLESNGASGLPSAPWLPTGEPLVGSHYRRLLI